MNVALITDNPVTKIKELYHEANSKYKSQVNVPACFTFFIIAIESSKDL